MNDSRTPLRARAAATAAAVLISAGLGVAGATTASAAEVDVDDVTFTWSINDESGGGAYFGGCNFLVAGAAGDAGGSRLWTEADGFYSAQEGNVSIRKPDSAGGWVTPTWSTKCLNAAGTAVTTQAGSTTGNEVVFAGGVGTVDVAAGTAEVAWDGDLTIVFYGGMTYWTVSDPTLTVASDGTGTITGTASGYGADMYDPSLWVELTPREITLATLAGVSLAEDGFSVTPTYLGVEIEVEAGGPSGAQVRTGANWGGFPQSWVDFNVETGQAAYWYSSGGAADPKKPTNPLSIAWSVDGGDDPGEPGEPGGDGDIEVGVEVPEEPTEPGEPGVLEWSIASGAVNLGQASAQSDGRFYAEGTLPTITVTDGREGGPVWELTGVATAFTSGSDSFGAEYLGWSPQVLSNPGGAYPGTSTSGTGGLASAARLAIGLDGHNADASTVTALLDLVAPADTPPGSYTSTVTLTMVG
ncbi:hypothetical protein [Pseudactinotalea sp.]|uniref:hypothetical protein n=1 Tax=Pseudactinotalea sp. TaxID=1926260 RepID=UPI003B3AA5C3